MAPGLRRFVLTVHLTCAVGWIGAALAYLALSVAALTSQDALTVRAAWIAKALIGWSVIVPLALGALATGVVMALGTPWGLFRHHWVLISFVLATLATIVLVLRMPTVSLLAGVARQADSATLAGLEADLLHPGAGLLLLLAIAGLNVYKPRGLTRYGWRKAQEERRGAASPGDA